MNALAKTVAIARKALCAVVLLLCIASFLWVMVYRLFLGFTPPWLDLTTLAVVALALVVALLVGGKKRTFNYRTGELE